MQFMDHQTFPGVGGLESPVVNAHSPSGRWQLVGLSTPNGKVNLSFWLNQGGQAHLLRRWELSGAQSARAFAARLKRQLAHVPDLASSSHVLALLPIHAQASNRSGHRHHAPVGRLSGA